MAKETSRERRKRQQEARNELRKQHRENDRNNYRNEQEFRTPREYKPSFDRNNSSSFDKSSSSESRSFNKTYDDRNEQEFRKPREYKPYDRNNSSSFNRSSSDHQEGKKYDKPFQKSERSSTSEEKPSINSLPIPEILDIQSEYFQKEYNVKKVALSEIAELKLNGKGFKDIKNLNLLVNLKRLEVIKNKLSSLKFLKGNLVLQHIDAHENEIVSSDDNNSEITELIQKSPQLKVLNLSHNQLTKTIVVKAKLMTAAVPVVSGIAEKLNRGKKIQQQPKDNLTSALLALILNDNKIEELKMEGSFQILNTIIISKNPLFKKFTNYNCLPALTKFGATETALEQVHPSISTCKQLQELRLSHNPQLFTKESCLKTLLEIEKLDSLKLLALSHNKISIGWDVMKTHLVMMIKKNRNLRNLSIVGNFEEHLEQVGADKFKEEIMNLFRKEGISLSHLDDKLVGEKQERPARNSRSTDQNSRPNRDRNERRQQEPRERRDRTNEKTNPRQEKQTEKSSETPAEEQPTETATPNEQLDDYQPIQISLEMQAKLEKELKKRKQANAEQSLVVQNAKDHAEEKKRKRELLGGFVEQDDKHSGVKKFVDVNTYKKRKSNVFQMLGQSDDTEESW